MELKPTSIKLSEEDREIIKRLENKLGLTMTDVIKIAVRRLEILESVVDKVSLPSKKGNGNGR